MNKGVGIGAFLLVSIPCVIVIYLYAWIVSALFISELTEDISPEDITTAVMDGTWNRILWMGGCYLIFLLVSVFRGINNGRPYIWAFVLIAGIFDVFVGFIPFIPTVFIILALVFGCLNRSQPQTVE